jgi:hypothetical protein
MGLGGQRHATAALPPGMTRYPSYKRLGRLQGRSGRVPKISPPPDFFFFFFFFCLSGVFPLWTIFVLFKSFRLSCHFAFHITVLTTNTTQTSMPPVRFEPTIPASERPQTHAFDRAATGIGKIWSPDRPARTDSLYRLRYPGSHPTL